MIYFDPVQQTFFDEAIHDGIPSTAQAISVAQHHDFLTALNAGAKINADLQIVPRPSLAHIWQQASQEWVLDNTVQQDLLQAACTAKIIELNVLAQDFISAQTGLNQVPEFEVQTWAIQGAEAKAWAVNRAAPTPILDKIAQARGVPADVLKQAALRKTQQYESLTALVAGQRQALQTRIEAAKTLDELDAIEIAFRLPAQGATK